MTQTLKKQDVNIDSGSDYYDKYYRSPNEVRETVLNYLLRNISFSTKRGKVRAINLDESKQASEDTGIPVVLVHKFISQFLVNSIKFKKFLHKNPEVLSSRGQLSLISILLRRFFRLAPVFDLTRARGNAKILQQKLNNLYFWPQIMTQVAVTIFITDLLDTQRDMKIIQSNLRVLCSCSAYAFHRTRNKIGLTTEYIKSL